jgi:hypothetical protein
MENSNRMDRMSRIKTVGLIKRFAFYLSLLLMPVNFSFAQNSPCPVDEKTLQFKGSPKEQARCLLRPVKPRGVLGDRLKNLPQPLESIVGEKIKIKKEDLRKYLNGNNISETSVGGSLDQKLSTATLPTGETIEALYFLIHDVSAPNYLLKPFPLNIDEAEWSGNSLGQWLKLPVVAHVFVNRVGESISVVEFGSRLPEKRYGTKFARDKLKEIAKGLQIHVELIQPRRSDPDWFPGNDALAPEIGFTGKQYERLALLYIAASIRRGFWLIPAYHCATDGGIPNAHDDPQKFELEKFTSELERLLNIFK